MMLCFRLGTCRNRDVRFFIRVLACHRCRLGLLGGFLVLRWVRRISISALLGCRRNREEAQICRAFQLFFSTIARNLGPSPQTPKLHRAQSSQLNFYPGSRVS